MCMQKDRNTYIIVGVLFVIYIALIIIAFVNIENFAEINAYMDNGATVIIDAGHGGEDGGAVANEIVEKDINLAISRKLAALLRASGFKVVETRTEDTMVNAEGESLRQRKVSDMQNRLAVFNSSPDNIVISIHQNKFPQEKYNGAQVFYSPNNPDSAELAESVRSNIKALVQPDNERECKKADKNIFLLNNAEVPAVIVECGFISNCAEARKLADDIYQQKIAFALFAGVVKYYIV